MNQAEPLYTNEAAPIIQELGGKMGGLEFLRRNVAALADRILPAQHVQPGETLSSVTVTAGDGGRYIVRGSHPNDFQGLVDVLPTDISKNERGVGQLIGAIRKTAASEEVMAYAQHENPSYDGHVVVGVQPFMSSHTWKRTDVVEHPNRPGDYLISVVTPMPSNLSGLSIDTVLYNSQENICEHLGGEGRVRIEEERSRVLIDVYRLIERSHLVRDDHTFQVELLDNGNDFYIAQVRAFMRKQIADFILDGKERLVFGVTPPEGIVLPVLQSPDGFDAEREPLSYDSPWAFLRTKNTHSLSLKFLAGNMQAYLISQSFGTGISASLEHHHFRYAQKAGVTVFEDNFRNHNDFTKILYGTNNPDVLRMQLGNLDILAQLTGRFPLQVKMEELALKARRIERTPVKIVSDGRTANVDLVGEWAS